MNSHLRAERNLEQIRRSRNAHEMRCCVWKRTSVRKEKNQLLISEFGESKIQTHNSTSERDPKKWWKRKISKCTTDQSPQNQTSSEVMSLQKRRVPRQAWRYIPMKGCTSSTVALRYIWWDHLLGITEKRRLFDIQATNLDFQFANDIHTREGLHQWTWRFSMDRCGERFSQCYRWEDCAINLVILIRGRQEELPELRLHGCSYQTEGSTIHGILHSQGTPWEQEVEDAMLHLLQPFTEGLEERDASSPTPTAGSDPTHEVAEEQSRGEKYFSVATDAGRDYSGRRYQESEKYHRFPTKRKSQRVPSWSERSQYTNQAWKNTKEARGWVCTFYKIRRLGHGRSQIIERGKRVEMRTPKRSNRTRWFHEVDSELSDEDRKHRKQCHICKDLFLRHRRGK